MGCPRPQTTRSDPKDIGQLANPLRDRLYTMMFDAPTKGLVLVSGFRDPGRQWDLRHDRVPHGQECNPAVKAVPATAVPAQLIDGQWVGGSEHQHRKAADIGGREMRWARENCHRYGLAQTVRSEDWHYEARGEPSVRILRYPGPTYEGTTNPPPSEEDTLKLDAEDREFITDAVNTAVAAIWKDEASDQKADEAERKRDGSLKGWVVATAKKVGVTRADAIAEDPAHKG